MSIGPKVNALIRRMVKVGIDEVEAKRIARETYGLDSKRKLPKLPRKVAERIRSLVADGKPAIVSYRNKWTVWTFEGYEAVKQSMLKNRAHLGKKKAAWLKIQAKPVSNPQVSDSLYERRVDAARESIP